MYFGSFYVNSYQDPGYYHSSAGNPNWGEKINDSNQLDNGGTAALPGLAGLDINDNMIHYSASNTTANGADMVLFDKNWLTSRGGTEDPDTITLQYSDTYNWSVNGSESSAPSVYAVFRVDWNTDEYFVKMTNDSTNKQYTCAIPAGYNDKTVEIFFLRYESNKSMPTEGFHARYDWPARNDQASASYNKNAHTYYLTGWKSCALKYNGALASFVNTPFPVRKTTKSNATYYEFDSTGATDNIYFDNLTGGSPVVQYGAGTTYGQKNGYNSGSGNQYGFYPFDKYTDQKRPGSDMEWTKDFGKDLAFGMKLEIKFTLGMNGQILAENGATMVDQVFDFSGDDDLWVYIDGNLILDLGGDHKQSTGTINFKTRTISSVSYDGTLTTSRNGSFASKIDNTDPKKLHTMTLYYLERGMHESNLKFGFSFNPLTDEVELEKEVKVDAVNEGLQEQVANAGSFNFTFADSTDSSKGKNTPYTVHNASTKEQTGTGTTSDTGVLSGLKNNQYAEIKKGFNVKDIISITESDPNTANGLQYKTSYKIIDEEVKPSSGMSNEITHGTGLSTGNFPYDTIVPDANPYINLTHMRAIFTNEVETKNLTITKEISNKYDPDAQFPITVGISVGGNALNTNSLQFYRDGSTAKEYFSGGKAYIKQGEEIKIPGIPKGAVVTVSETTPMPTNYSFVSIDNDAHSVNGNLKTANYLTLNTDDYVTIVNKIAENGLIITKALDNDIVDYATPFKITIEKDTGDNTGYHQVTETLEYTHYEWDTASSSFVPTTGTLSATGADNAYEIHSGCSLVLPNLPVGTKIRVKETDCASDYYNYSDMTIAGATMEKDNDNRTGIVKMLSSAATLTIKNLAIRETIIITKETDYDQDNSLFGVKVEMKQRNSNGNYTPVNVSGEYGGYKVLGTDTTWLDHNSEDGDGVYKIKKTGQIKIDKVPRGTYVQVTEPFIGTSSVTGNQRFTANYVHVTNSTGATAGENYLNKPW